MNRYNLLVNEFEDFKRRTRENEMNLSQNMVGLKNDSEENRRKHEGKLREVINDYEGRIVEYENRVRVMTQ